MGKCADFRANLQISLGIFSTLVSRFEIHKSTRWDERILGRNSGPLWNTSQLRRLCMVLRRLLWGLLVSSLLLGCCSCASARAGTLAFAVSSSRLVVRTRDATASGILSLGASMAPYKVLFLHGKGENGMYVRVGVGVPST